MRRQRQYKIEKSTEMNVEFRILIILATITTATLQVAAKVIAEVFHKSGLAAVATCEVRIHSR